MASALKDANAKSAPAKPADSIINSPKTDGAPASDIPTWRARPRMVPFPQDPASKADKPDAPAPPPAEKAPAAKKRAVEL